MSDFCYMVFDDRVNGDCQMSVLIKGMKMPKSCFDCSFCDDEESFCKAQNEFLNLIISNRDRATGCPLAELPEHHGRLIDENEVRTVMNWLLTQPQRPTWNDTYHAIQEMNAVIEAEGEDE